MEQQNNPPDASEETYKTFIDSARETLCEQERKMLVFNSHNATEKSEIATIYLTLKTIILLNDEYGGRTDVEDFVQKCMKTTQHVTQVMGQNGSEISPETLQETTEDCVESLSIEEVQALNQARLAFEKNIPFSVVPTMRHRRNTWLGKVGDEGPKRKLINDGVALSVFLGVATPIFTNLSNGLMLVAAFAIPPILNYNFKTAFNYSPSETDFMSVMVGTAALNDALIQPEKQLALPKPSNDPPQNDGYER